MKDKLIGPSRKSFARWKKFLKKVIVIELIILTSLALIYIEAFFYEINFSTSTFIAHFLVYLFLLSYLIIILFSMHSYSIYQTRKLEKSVENILNNMENNYNE